MKSSNIVIQHDIKECGVACLMMILRYYNIDAPYSDIRKRLNVNKEGVTLKKLATVSNIYGLDAKAFKIDMGGIACLKNSKLFPCIALVQNDGNMSHYVVVYSCRHGKVTFADPAIGSRTMKIAGFNEIWSGYIISFVARNIVKKKVGLYTDEKKRYKYMLSVIKEHKVSISITLVLSIISASIGTFLSMYIKIIVDDIVPNQNEFLFGKLTIAFLFLAGMDAWIGYIRSKLTNLIDVHIGNKIMNSFISHIFKLPIEFFSSRDDGDIVTRLKDIEKVKDLFVSTLFVYSYNVMIMFVVGIVIIFYNKILFLVAIIPCILLWCFMKAANVRMQSSASLYINNNSLVMSSILDELRNISIIKAFSREKTFSEKNRSSICGLNNKYFEYANLIGKYNAIINLIKGIANIVMIAVGVILVFRGVFTVGTLILCNTLVMYLWEPVVNMASMQSSIAMGRIAFERISDVFEEEIEDLKSQDILDDVEGKIEFKDVSFAYHENNVMLEKINFLIRPHCITSLIGPSGCGKTSIAKMVVGICKPVEGSIYIDDKIQSDVGLKELRRNIIYVEQETKLFNTSIYNNLKLFDSEISDQELLLLCQKAGLDILFNSLPNGWNTVIMEGATNLSGGQKQLIALVRALVQKPKVLLLDEITNGMDSATEQRIMRLLNDLKDRITIFCITHKNSVVEYSDHIYEVHNRTIMTKK